MENCTIHKPIYAASSTSKSSSPQSSTLSASTMLLCFVLPAVLSVIFCEIERKLGWIKEGDLKLN